MQSFFSSSSLLFFTSTLLLTLFPFSTFSDDSPIYHIYITPNFTVTQLQFIGHSGAFLSSQNNTFTAALTISSDNPLGAFLSVIHTATNTVIWSANNDSPVSTSVQLCLTTGGLAIADDSGKLVWSTPRLSSPVSSLRLLETGNLALLDASDVVLWQSFDNPTDTLVPGQRLLAGRSLTSAVGNYSVKLLAGHADLVLEWMGRVYWRLSMELKAFKESNGPVSYMEINSGGLYLHGGGGDNSSVVVIFFFETPFNFAIVRLGTEGRFEIIGFDGGVNAAKKLVGPSDACRVPEVCGKLGMCFTSGDNELVYCTCPDGFMRDLSGGCMLEDNSLSLPNGRACNVIGYGSGDFDSQVIKYLKVSNGSLDNLSMFFVETEELSSRSLSFCQDLCSSNCSCLGLVYNNDSSGCNFIENYIGSVFPSRDSGLSMHVKAFGTLKGKKENMKKQSTFPVVGFVLISLFGFCIIISVLLLIFSRFRKQGNSMDLSHQSSSFSLGTSSLVGLPLRFKYEELAEATENFSTMVGSGGFGKVYKGTFPDQSLVAVKKITNLGVSGKKEFLTELATIGSIRHINLVKLKGYCVHDSHRFLVYEFMKRGSLEKILFGDGPVLEWPDRFNIALGTARALAYLHSQCHQKIIHCDIKPENILLNDRLQAKVSDFGLSKLLDHETSKLVTAMRGTRGYLAPEWLAITGVTNKADVYSFGMVLLEIVSGRRNLSKLTESSDVGEIGSEESGPSLSNPGLKKSAYFPSLALEMHKQRRYLELADPRVEGGVSSEEVEMLVRVALCCVHVVPELRPTMENVVAMLEGRVALGVPIAEALRFLR